jgi:hypothetical protein
MTTKHQMVSWFAGDDWQINATLLDENGTPFDLSGNPPIKWALMNASFQRALDETDVDISVTDAAAGKCAIIIPAAKSATLAAGRYTDVIRIVFGGMTATLSYGFIYVSADPWQADRVPVTSTVERKYQKPKLVA